MDIAQKEQMAEISASLADWQRKSALIALVLMFAGMVSMGVMIFSPGESGTPEDEAGIVLEDRSRAWFEGQENNASPDKAPVADSNDNNI